MKTYYVYLLSSQHSGTLYIGVTSNLIRRIWEHKNKFVKGFTEKYAVDKLVYFEEFGCIELAIKREKHLKEWPRQWKLNLITQHNPSWKDLYYEIIK